MAILGMKDMKALIIETFGAGNAPNVPWFIDAIAGIIKKGVIVLNVTQCNLGTVEMSRYKTGQALLEVGVIGGFDITIEAAVTKVMFLLGQQLSHKEMISKLNVSISGEITLQPV
jgi:L-asparaginase